MRNRAKCPDCGHEFDEDINLMQMQINRIKIILQNPPELTDEQMMKYIADTLNYRCKYEE